MTDGIGTHLAVIYLMESKSPQNIIIDTTGLYDEFIEKLNEVVKGNFIIH